MRIGFDAKRAFCNHRGLGNYSRNLLSAYLNRHSENDYYLFTPKIAQAFQDLDYPNAQRVTPDTFFSRKFPSIWRTKLCINEIKKLNLDLYHGLSHELPQGIEKSGTKTVVTMHDLIFLTHPHLYPLIDKKLYEIKYRRSCQVANKIIAISKQTKNDLIRFWNIEPDKIDVVYQGCQPIFYQEITERQIQYVRQKYHLPNDYLLHVGAIERRKNQEVILKAMRCLKDELPLVLVGRRGAYLKELQKLAPKLFNQRVILLENVMPEELPAIYASANVFIYPSLYEGFGIPILEAMGSGVPVITTDGACFREAGGDACRYVQPDDSELLAEEISDFLHHEDQRKEAILRGKRQILNFSEESISDNLQRVYESIL